MVAWMPLCTFGFAIVLGLQTSVVQGQVLPRVHDSIRNLNSSNTRIRRLDDIGVEEEAVPTVFDASAGQSFSEEIEPPRPVLGDPGSAMPSPLDPGPVDFLTPQVTAKTLEVSMPELPGLGLNEDAGDIESADSDIGSMAPQGRWWESNVASPLRPSSNQLQITLNSLLVGALANSAQIQLISDSPLISETEITAADAAFDWTSFMEARWDDISEPVGSTLTTGGPDRLRDHNATFELGVRRRNTLGGEFEIGQRFGHQNSNSVFFIPQDQGSSRLTLSYTQPLLRGAGRVYNTSLTVLAKLRTKLERNEFERQLQDHLLSITREYWTLYFERGKYLQQQRLLENGLKILNELESRKEVDALQSQIVRARAAVENRRAQLVRTRLTIRMSEARIRSLVNDPSLGDTLGVELIPQEHLQTEQLPVELQHAVSEALKNRPEIEVAIQQVKSASVRLNMGKREALPLLNVVLETYASGLEGNSSIGRAFNEQFTEGEPSYGIGLQYEYPLWNRAATARVQQRRLELRRLQHQFRQTVESLKLEVEIAVHQVNAAYESLDAKDRAMDAAAEEVSYLFDRWQLLPVDNGSASLLLEDLLEAQDRLADGELGLLQALLDHNLSQVTFKRSIGTLLSNHQVAIDRNCNCNLPQQEVRQAGAPRSVLPLMPMEIIQASPAIESKSAVPMGTSFETYESTPSNPPFYSSPHQSTSTNRYESSSLTTEKLAAPLQQAFGR